MSSRATVGVERQYSLRDRSANGRQRYCWYRTAMELNNSQTPRHNTRRHLIPASMLPQPLTKPGARPRVPLPNCPYRHSEEHK